MGENDLRISDFVPIVGLSNYQGRNSDVRGDSEWQKNLVKEKINLLRGYNLAAYAVTLAFAVYGLCKGIEALVN